MYISATDWLPIRVCRILNRRTQVRFLMRLLICSNLQLNGYDKTRNNQYSASAGILSKTNNWSFVKHKEKADKIITDLYLYLAVRCRSEKSVMWPVRRGSHKLDIVPHIVCANSEGTDKSARIRRLAWALAIRICDTFPFLMGWLNSG